MEIPKRALQRLKVVKQRLLLSRSVKRQIDKPAEQLLIGNPRGLPQLGIHADRREARERVDLVEVKLAAVAIEVSASASHGVPSGHFCFLEPSTSAIAAPISLAAHFSSRGRSCQMRWDCR